MGAWYKIIPTLRFSTLHHDEEEKLLYKPIDKGNNYTNNIPDVTMKMDPAYYPVKIDGVRIFLRECWHKTKTYSNTNKERKIIETNQLVETVLYSPELQAFMKCSRNRLELKTHPNVVFEDPEYVAMLCKM